MKLSAPRPFNLAMMALSHGFVELAPFKWDRGKNSLRLVVKTRGDRAFGLTITSSKDCEVGQSLNINIKEGPKPNKEDLAMIKKKITWIFRLDEDYTPFQNMCAKIPHLKWVKTFGLGPFLRNNDLFEEFTKVLFSTNISWEGTKLINRKMIEHLGVRIGPNYTAFPSAADVAGKTEAYLRKNIRLGYRAPYLIELAETFANGGLRMEDLVDPTRPTVELGKILKSLKGFGPYSVNSLLVSFSRYENIILDSWIRKKAAERHFKSKKVTDSSILKIYSKWGSWAGLACWFECAYDTWIKDELDGHRKGVMVDLKESK